MAYVRLPGGIKVAMEYEVFGKVVVNVYHVTTPDPIITIKLVDIAELFEDWWTNSIGEWFSSDITLNAVTALNLDVPNGEKVTNVVTPPSPGQILDPAASNNVALVASFRTAQTGRSFRGRAYHAGMNASSITANEIGVSKAGNILASYLELDIALGIENAQQVVASFISEGAPRAVGIGTPIDSYVVNLRVDTQRRRLPTS